MEIDSIMDYDPAKRYLLYLYGADKGQYSLGNNLFVGETGFHKLYFLISGSATLKKGNRADSFSSGTLFYFAPGSCGSILFESEAKVYSVFFDGSPALYYEPILPKTPWCVDKSFHSAITVCFERLISHEILCNDALNAKNLTDLLTLLTDLYGRERKKAGNAPIHAVMIREYVRRHYRENLSLDALAAEFHLSKFHICRIFKNAFCMTFLQYQFELRLLSASELIKSTDMTISDISNYLGFESPQAMIRLFKKKYGCTPGDYRKSALPALA